MRKLGVSFMVVAVVNLGVALLGFSVGPSPAYAGDPFPWGGQGYPNPTCPVGTTGTMLWIFNDNGSAVPTSLTINNELQSGSWDQQGGGTYHFLATIDANNFPPTSASVTYSGALGSNTVLTLSGCNEGQPSKLNSTTVTAIHNASHGVITSASVGDAVHDSAAVNGSGGTPTGEVKFSVWLGKTECSGTPDATDTVALSGGVAHPALPETVPSGGLAYQGEYLGDSNYNGSTSACEPLTASTPGDLDTTIVTALHNANHGVITNGSVLPMGTSLHDSAVVDAIDSSEVPVGQVSFRFYSNGTCSGDGVAAGTVTLDAQGKADPSDVVGPLSPGSYSFQATYLGHSDGLVFKGSKSACEPFSVTGDQTPAPGRIEIEKQTIPDGDTASFAFTGEIATTLGDGGLAGKDVAAGTYTVSELSKVGWTLTSIVCNDSNSSGAGSTATFQVAAGETVRCVFTNTKEVVSPPPPTPAAITIKIVKTNDANGDGTFTNKEEAPEPGSAVPFHLVITNTSSTDVTITDLSDAFGGLTIDLLAGKCAQLSGTTLAPGESVSCTFTLKDYSPPATGSAKVNTAEVCVTNTAANQNACDEDTSSVRSAEVLATTVTPPPSHVSTPPQGTAFTGLDDTVPLALAALLLLLAGSGLLRAGLRRSRS